MIESVNMKIAIFAGGIREVGGGERLVLSMAEALNADLIVPSYSKTTVRHFGSEINIISLDKKLPKNYALASIFSRQLFKKINFRDDYDFFVSVDNSYPLKKHRPHLLYCQTPPRELYDMYHIVVNAQGTASRRMMVKIWCIVNRFLDQNFVKKYVQNIACNSHNVRNRIYKAYQKEAIVIYPPTRTESYKYKPSEGFWLSVNRIHPWKRIGLQIEAFRGMPHRRLKIVGDFSSTYAKKLVSTAPENVEFLGNISEEQLKDLYSRCEGHITTAIDEDFGLTAVEAMASGKPVVAVKEGGYLETVLDGITGRLTAPVVNEIIKSIEEVSTNPEKYKEACMERAKLFDYRVFKEQLEELVLNIYERGKN
ncbi:D-inositol-3-phosphate glycosyltransferase [subsurface metagenome]